MRMGRFDHCFPFVAVAGQDSVKQALLLCAVNPAIGGVLLAGEKGTAKSTLVRGLAALLEDSPFVELPLNVTEDRLVGSVDLEAALQRGQLQSEGGLLQQADGGFLYVDEVNLLSEHIVNILLEVSSTGENIVEREGISFRHQSRFLLVGSMNPEEGRLRPHFADRFGLYVPTHGERDPGVRCEIIRRRLEYEQDPVVFESKWESQTLALQRKLNQARLLLPRVMLPERQRRFAVQLAIQGGCAGHRGELAMCEASRARAALAGRLTVTGEDIQAVAPFALAHRLREAVSAPETPEKLDQENDTQEWEKPKAPEPEAPEFQQEDSSIQCAQDSNQTAEAVDRWDDIQPIQQGIRLSEPVTRQKLPAGTGKRLKVRSHSSRGRYIRAALPNQSEDDVALDATLRAAASHPKGNSPLMVDIRSDDLRVKVREQRTGATILFLVDASGSMGAMHRMGVVKGAVLSLLSDAYEKRDTVGIIAFRKERADTLLPLTRSVDLAQKQLRQLHTGGKTPLAHGLLAAGQLLKIDRLKNPGSRQYLVVVSDGRTNVPLWSDSPTEDAWKAAKQLSVEPIQSLVLDPEEGFMQFGMAKKLAEALNGEYVHLKVNSSQVLGSTVREFLK